MPRRPPPSKATRSIMSISGPRRASPVPSSPCCPAGPKSPPLAARPAITGFRLSMIPPLAGWPPGCWSFRATPRCCPSPPTSSPRRWLAPAPSPPCRPITSTFASRRAWIQPSWARCRTAPRRWQPGATRPVPGCGSNTRTLKAGTLPPSPTGITVFTPFRVNVRSMPTIDGAILDILSAGTTVNAIGRNAGNNWLQVEYGSTTGWVAVWVVMASEATSALPVTDSSAAVAVVGFDLYGRGVYDLVMRAGPGLNYGTLATIPAGTEVLLLARTADSDWLKATYQGTEGWLAAWVTVGNGDFNNLEVEEEPAAP